MLGIHMNNRTNYCPAQSEYPSDGCFCRSHRMVSSSDRVTNTRISLCIVDAA